MTQLEFDYELQGDTWNNFFSFWLDGNDGNWVRETEIDSLESMPGQGGVQHNFAGLGHETFYKKENWRKGHSTTWMSDTMAQQMDCAFGSETCARSGDLATSHYEGKKWEIDQSKLFHHFVIDYWITKGTGSLKVSNIRAKVAPSFCNTCKAA